MAVNIGGEPAEVIVVPDDWEGRVRYITVAAGIAFTPLYGRRCRLVGWSIRETTGSAVAGFDLMDGQAISAPAPVTVNLAAGTSGFAWVGHPGPMFKGGLSFNPRVGSMAGAVWVEDAQG